MKKKLKPAIRECLDNGAAYVYVAFKKHIFVEKDQFTMIDLLKNILINAVILIAM